MWDRKACITTEDVRGQQLSRNIKRKKGLGILKG